MTNDRPASAVYRYAEVAALLGVHRVTLHNWVRRGYFPKPVPFGPGHSVAWPRQQVEDWLAERGLTVTADPETG